MHRSFRNLLAVAAAGGLCLAGRDDDGDPVGAVEPRQRLLLGAGHHVRGATCSRPGWPGARPPDVPGGAGTVLPLDSDPHQACALGSLRDEIRPGLTH